MEPVEPLKLESQQILAGYRRDTPDRARAEGNWAAVERKLANERAEPRANDGRGYGDASDVAAIADHGRWPRMVIAGSLSVAIAAAVLLLVRGTLAGVSALAMTAGDAAHQAADIDKPTERGGAWKSGPANRTAPTTGVTAPASAVPTPTTSVTAQAPASPAAPPAGPEPARAVTPRSPNGNANPEPATAPGSLAEQTKLLSRARTAVASERYADALRVSRDYQAQFPSGALLEEHMAIEAIARCRLGEDAAEASARFLAAYTASPHAARVRAACGGRQ